MAEKVSSLNSSDVSTGLFRSSCTFWNFILDPGSSPYFTGLTEMEARDPNEMFQLKFLRPLHSLKPDGFLM